MNLESFKIPDLTDKEFRRPFRYIKYLISQIKNTKIDGHYDPPPKKKKIIKKGSLITSKV